MTEPQSSSRLSPEGESSPAMLSHSPPYPPDIAHPERTTMDVREVTGKSKAKFNQHGVTVTFKHAKENALFKVSCHSRVIEESDVDIKMADTDEVLSNVTSVKVEGSKSQKIKSKISFPLFTAPLQNEEVLVLTDKSKEHSMVPKTKKKKKTWYCTVTAKVSELQSFVAVCRTKKETFVISPDAMTLQSTVFPGVEFKVPTEAFSGLSHATLETLNIDRAPVMEEMTSVLCSTPIYMLDIGKNQLSRDIEIHLPRPVHNDRTGNGKLVAYSVRQSHEGVCEVFPTKPEVRNESLVIKSSSVTGTVCLEVKKDVSSEEMSGLLKDKVLELYHQCIRREFPVCFLVFCRRQRTAKQYDVIVSCCLKSDTFAVRSRWQKDGFQELSATFHKVISKQKFKLTCSKGFKILDNVPSPLTFHPKRQNWRKLRLTSGQDDVQSMCHVEITSVDDSNGVQYKATHVSLKVLLTLSEEAETVSLHSAGNVTGYSTSSSQPQKRKDQDATVIYSLDSGVSFRIPPVTPILVQQPVKNSGIQEAAIVERPPVSAASSGPVISRGLDRYDTMTTVASSPAVVKKSSMKSFGKLKTAEDFPSEALTLLGVGDEIHRENFLDEGLIYQVFKTLKDDCCPVLCLLGIAFTTVEHALIEAEDINKGMHELLKKWRDDNKTFDDQGLPCLLAATRKSGRFDVSMAIFIQLKLWNEANRQRKNLFFNWLEKAYVDHNLLIPPDYPEPMSDQFLAYLGRKLSPSAQLADQLSCPSELYRQIRIGAGIFINKHFRIMKILTMYRDTVQDRIQAMTGLFTALKVLDEIDVKDDLLSCVNGWYGRTAMIDDPFRMKIRIWLDTFYMPGPRVKSARGVLLAPQRSLKVLVKRLSSGGRKNPRKPMSRRDSVISRKLLVI